MLHVIAATIRRALLLALASVPALATAGEGGTPAVGDAAPDAVLTNHQGQEVRLSELWAAAPLVVYFFPKAFTPG